jgi:hypothetical protein
MNYIYESSPNIPLKKGVALKFGHPSSGTLTLTVATPATSIIISSLILNVDDFEDPIIKLDVSSSVDTTNFSGSVNIQVFKNFTNQSLAIPIGPQFTIATSASAPAPAAKAAKADPSFFVCDCGDNCFTGCYIYTVVATSVPGDTGVIIFNNVTLSALIVSNHGFCCN